MEKRKRCRTVIMAVFCSVLAVAVARAGHCAEADWELVDSDPATSDFLYNKATVARGAKGIVTVETRAVYSEQGKADVLEVLDPKRYARLAYTLFVYDIECSKEESLLKRVVHYDDRGAEIASFDLASKTEWEDIPLNSRLEKVQQAECR